MTWNGLQKDIHRHTETCKSCKKQVVQKSPTKFAWTTPWKVLCIDLIVLYVLEGKDGSGVKFMCLIMINPARNWFELVELPVVDIPGKRGQIKSLNRVF